MSTRLFAVARAFWAGCLAILFFFSVPAAVHAENNSVFDAINGGESTTTQEPDSEAQQPADIPGGDSGSLLGYLVQVVFSLGLIIVLIYFVLRFLGKRQIGQQQGPIKVISAASLGNGKTVQIVLIGDSLYVLGVGENVQLLRVIPPGEEADLILADAEIQPVKPPFSWMPFGQKKQMEEEMLFPSGMEEKSFQELLDQQWEDVKNKRVQKAEWMKEDEPNRGDLR